MEKALFENPIELATGTAPEFSVIWLHGLGADGSDFVPVVPELGLTSAPVIRFIFPHAPYLPVTCNGGYEMRAWYDIISLEPGSRVVDEAGLLAARRMASKRHTEKMSHPRSTISIATDECE